MFVTVAMTVCSRICWFNKMTNDWHKLIHKPLTQDFVTLRSRYIYLIPSPAQVCSLKYNYMSKIKLFLFIDLPLFVHVHSKNSAHVSWTERKAAAKVRGVGVGVRVGDVSLRFQHYRQLYAKGLKQVTWDYGYKHLTPVVLFLSFLGGKRYSSKW